MNLGEITPLVLTANEAANIVRSLAPLSWAQRVIVLDSCSADETCQIAGDFPNVRVQQRRFDSHSEQWNYGIDLVETEWVLALDADYVLSANFRNELAGLEAASDQNAFFAPFTYCVFGHRLRACVYPPRSVLFRKERSRFVQDGHTQRLVFEGRAGVLKSRILHDDRKPLGRWIAAQDRYASLEAKHLCLVPSSQLSQQDRLRLRVDFAPLVMAFYLFIIRGLVTGGWPAWYYVFQRVIAEMLLSLHLFEERMGRSPSKADVSSSERSEDTGLSVTDGSERHAHAWARAGARADVGAVFH